jgi:transcription elongation factor GreA
MTKYPMTIEGQEALREELEFLKRTRRPEIIRAIAEARAHGDLRENAEYHAAREQQSFIEGRISDIEGKLSFAQIIDITQIPFQGRVVFGSTVGLVRLDDEVEVSYKIVGEDEANVALGKISIGSPVARALIGKEDGDIIGIQTPSGICQYEIVSIQHK